MHREENETADNNVIKCARVILRWRAGRGDEIKEYNDVKQKYVRGNSEGRTGGEGWKGE
jgi:hypothetical protein